MSTIMVDAATLDKLLAAGEVIEFRDGSRAAVVRVTKAPDVQRLIERVGPENWPSDEELDRIEREEPSYTPEQVMERLRGLTK